MQDLFFIEMHSKPEALAEDEARVLEAHVQIFKGVELKLIKA